MSFYQCDICEQLLVEGELGTCEECKEIKEICLEK